jgi:hypothetical protein
MQDLLDVLLAFIPQLFGKDATTRMGEWLFVFVGWIAGALAILILALATSPGAYNTSKSFFDGLALALILGGLLGPFGGLVGAHLAKDASLGVQIASAAFFGALGGGLIGGVCFTTFYAT